MSLGNHFASLPADLATALEAKYEQAVQHFLRGEPDDAQVDGGHFCEAALRYLEFKMNGSFTPIDGKQKPNRKVTVEAAKRDTSLPPSLRAQVPQAIELIMDFRNNRSNAHLGDIDPNQTDAACVIQNLSWVVSEIARIESNDTTEAIQELIEGLARRHVPLIQQVGDTPIILDPHMEVREQVLVLLYNHGEPVDMSTLYGWTSHNHITRFREKIIENLAGEKLIYLDNEKTVHLLVPGEIEAQELLVSRATSVN